MGSIKAGHRYANFDDAHNLGWHNRVATLFAGAMLQAMKTCRLIGWTVQVQAPLWSCGSAGRGA
jgi:hypothetical protein